MSCMITKECRRAPGATRVAGLAILAGLLFAGAGVAWTSPATVEGQKAGDQPCAGDVSGYLGITSLTDCRGCTLTITQESKGWKKAWSFATEPRIAEIAPGSPAARALQVGDEIVGIDGVLITTADGGRRFASIEPNQTVTIRYRRRGRTADAVLRGETRCGQFVEGLKASPLAGLAATSTLADVLSRYARGIRIVDGRQRDITITLRHGLEVGVPLKAADPSVEKREPFVIEGRLGINWSCGSCSGVMKNGRRVWDFSGPVRITKVEAGGAADRAGIQPGDKITAANGHPIESKRGGEAFSDVHPGQPMQLTLRGPDGRARTVTVVPAAKDSQADTAGQRTTITFDRQRPSGEGAAPPSAFGYLGLNFSCGPCSSTWRDGREVWTFSGPVRVVGVEVGGPAHRAGIGLGEEIVAVDGKPIQSREGADAFTNLRPGQPTPFTLIGSDGRERTLTVVPGGRHNEESLD